MQSKQVREVFLKFFESKGHKIVESASLIPSDPTVLLTIAGMLPFKPIFEGKKAAEFPRATSSQKCIRVNDLENVGVTPRHHTFFEMLGNFSFGDYFKEDAIKFAYELLTVHYKLPLEKLYFSVFESDDEAYELWKKIGVPENKIYRMGAKDNFWAAGPTGACGPCSEIYYDLGIELDSKQKNITEDGNRFVEIWNLVFMQFNRDEKGNLTPLPKKNIDTGMGLERLCAVLQGASSNFDTDLFQPIIQKAAILAGIKYKQNEKSDRQLKVIADHLRASVHLICDGVMPTNEGRGYILRRLIRRAYRCGHQLGINNVFLSNLAEQVFEIHGTAYPALIQRKKIIQDTLLAEESNFQKTLQGGLKLLDEMIANKKVDGFLLHDTFGFPIELTQEIAIEKGFTVDLKEFEAKMEDQRSKSKTLKGAKWIPTMGGEVQVHNDEEAKAMSKHHSVTHLLHAALHEVLGSHATQAGSLVTPEYLRFDFQHPKAMTTDEIKKVQDRVNEIINQKIQRELINTNYEEATKKLGAIAFFGEKYGNDVRVIKFGNFSTELCGGTHVQNTGDIEQFVIAKEGSVAAGVRRIEAYAGTAAKQYLEQLKLQKEEEAKREAQKALEKAQSKMQLQNVGQWIADIEKETKNIGNKKLWLKQFKDLDQTLLKEITDQALNKIGSNSVAFITNQNGETIQIACKVSTDLTKTGISAGELIKQTSLLLGGKGGGRPDFAQGGGKDISKLNDAIALVEKALQN